MLWVMQKKGNVYKGMLGTAIKLLFFCCKFSSSKIQLKTDTICIPLVYPPAQDAIVTNEVL